jgi:hypothetical protein
MSRQAQRVRKYSRKPTILVEIETYSTAPFDEANRARQEFWHESCCAEGCEVCQQMADELWSLTFWAEIEAQVEFWFRGKTLC